MAKHGINDFLNWVCLHPDLTDAQKRGVTGLLTEFKRTRPKNASVRKRSADNPVTRAVWHKVKSLRSQGFSQREIAELTRMNAGRVCEILTGQRECPEK